MTDGALRHPSTTGERVRFCFALVLSIGGQTLQNISVPMFLSGSDVDMGVMLTYTTFIYFVFFTMVDLFLGFFTPRGEQIAMDMNHKMIAWVGLQNALCGVGVLFAGSSTRTPLPLQMTFFLLANQLAPFYKVLRRYGFHAQHLKCAFRGLGKRGGLMLAAATTAYVIAMVLVLQDNLSHDNSHHSLSPYCLLFIFGTLFTMMYNVDQDSCMSNARTIHIHEGGIIPPEKMNFLAHLRRDIMTLRYQTTWLFVFSWIGPLLSLAGASQGGVLTQDIFYASWANLLPFSNKWINVLNIAYILTFFGNIYINRFDSAFTMIINNVSAVSAMWTGWVPTLMPYTVGFTPNYAKTISAMVLSIVAMFPSWEFSKEFRKGLCEADRQVDADETSTVNDHLLDSSNNTVNYS